MREHDITVSITCDCCDDIIQIEDSDIHIDDAYDKDQEYAKENGWQITNSKDKCPKCLAKDGEKQ